MRTTIEIPDSQRAKLLKIAAQRGEKGFSGLVQEALARFLDENEKQQALVAQALEVLGSFSEESARTLEANVRELREAWR